MVTALVTGASRGVGRGIATALAEDGFKVFATGRSVASAALPEAVVKIPCDHMNDEETDAAFQRIGGGTAALEVLVNCAWGGYEKMVENGAFTWSAPFWEQTGVGSKPGEQTGVRARIPAKPTRTPGHPRLNLSIAIQITLGIESSPVPDFLLAKWGPCCRRLSAKLVNQTASGFRIVRNE